mgnify:CR=1 FL=1
MLLSLYAEQWPGSAECITLASFVVHRHLPTINALEFLHTLSNGVCLETKKGICSILPTIVTFEAQRYPHVVHAQSIQAHRLVALSVAILWVLYHTTPSSLAAVVYHKRFQFPTTFWGLVAAEILFVFAPPQVIAPAFEVGRPDLQHFVMCVYFRWTAEAKSERLLAEVGRILADTAFEYDSVSTTWQQAKYWLHADGTVVGAAKGYDNATGQITPIRKCNVHLDGHALFAISARDKLLLAFRHLWHGPSAWTQHGCPRAAPSVFHRIEKQHPYLFGKGKSTDVSILEMLPETPVLAGIPV